MKTKSKRYLIIILLLILFVCFLIYLLYSPRNIFYEVPSIEDNLILMKTHTTISSWDKSKKIIYITEKGELYEVYTDCDADELEVLNNIDKYKIYCKGRLSRLNLIVVKSNLNKIENEIEFSKRERDNDDLYYNIYSSTELYKIEKKQGKYESIFLGGSSDIPKNKYAKRIYNLFFK